MGKFSQLFVIVAVIFYPVQLAVSSTETLVLCIVSCPYDFFSCFTVSYQEEASCEELKKQPERVIVQEVGCREPERGGVLGRGMGSCRE